MILSRSKPWHAPPGYVYVGCLDCGNVVRVPLDEGETPPWCIHSEGRYRWTAPKDPASTWTIMVPVQVSGRYGYGTADAKPPELCSGCRERLSMGAAAIRELRGYGDSVDICDCGQYVGVEGRRRA